MSAPAPKIVILAGPNGAGKSTLAPKIVRDFLQFKEFVNADTVAAGLSAFGPEGVAIEAGRIVRNRLRELAGERASFCLRDDAGDSFVCSLAAGVEDSGV